MSIWNSFKLYAKAHPVRTAVIGGVILIGAAALITGIVFSGGGAAVPAAAGLAALMATSQTGVGIGIASLGAVLLGAGGATLLADAGLKTRGARSRPKQKIYTYDGFDESKSFELKEIKPSKNKQNKTTEPEIDPKAFKSKPSASVSIAKSKSVMFATTAKQNDGKKPEVVPGFKL